MRLQGKTALITGASGNIGLATARLLLAEGAKLVAVDMDAARLRDAFVDVPAERIALVAADVTSASDTQRMAHVAIERFGGLDVFYANAGIEGVVTPPADYPDDVYDKVMEVNVKGVFFGLKHVVPRMRDRGSVIITSSIMGLMGAPSNMAYTASKHAVVGLMRSAAAAEAARGIRVNTVHPGMVDSEMLRRLIARHPDPEAQEKGLLARIKLGRFVLPEEIGRTVLFLASDDSAMITSQTFLVDGGYMD